MTRKIWLILIGLVSLTIVGLFGVSNLVSNEGPGTEAGGAGVHAGDTPRVLPSAGVRKPSNVQPRTGDLLKAKAQLADLRQAVKNSEWPRAQELMLSFELRDKRLPSAQLRHPDVSPLLQDFFDLYVVQLQRALNEKQPRQVDIALSQLNGILDETASRFGAQTVPVEIQRLHYLVRELQLWREAGDEQMLQTRKIALNEAWRDASALPRTRGEGQAISAEISNTIKQITEADSASKIGPLLSELEERLKALDDLFPESSSDDD